MSIEIEKKYRLTPEQRNQIVKSLNDIGAKFEGEDFEENIIFSNHQLLAKHALVRVRKTESIATLTFKQRLQSESTAKHQDECETKVEDAGAAVSILEGIGLRRSIVYEKKRKTYSFRNAEIVLDELPFGLFMEIEGTLTAIAEIEMLLSVDGIDAESKTYPRLTLELGVKNGGVTEARFSKS